MSITYTNRKGVTYYLCRTTTRTGKPRYTFAREPRGEPVAHLPEGYKISESVNGQVSLARDLPAKIAQLEVAAVEMAVRRHPRAGNYRVAVKDDRIEIFERWGPDMDELIAIFGESGLQVPESRVAAARAEHDRHAHFKPVMRFLLFDADQRTFRAERWCYRGRIDGWLDLHRWGRVRDLARDLVPALGTEDFFELY